MSENLIDETRNWLPYFYGSKGWNDRPEIMLSGRPVSIEKVNFMYDLFRFMIEGGFLNDCTIIWLKSNSKSVRQAFEFYNAQVVSVDQINLNTAKSKINYDKNRMKKLFGDDLIYHIMIGTDEYLSEAYDKLLKLERKYLKDKKYMDAVVIKPNKAFINKELNDNEWKQVLMFINMYTTAYIKNINEGNNPIFNKRAIGYFNYIISSNELSTKDLERLEQLKKVLNIEV